MTSFAPMVPYVGIAVLALVVIFLAIWVARLSSKIKRLTDTMMIDSVQPRRQIPSQGSYNPIARDTASRNSQDEPSRASQSRSSQRAATRNQPGQQQAQQAYRQQYEETPSGMRKSAGAIGQMSGYPDGEDEFFENYRSRNDAEQPSRGRGKPKIPFGEDKNVMDRRRDIYTGNAADIDYDPDSIDFTRVQGYRNLYR